METNNKLDQLKNIRTERHLTRKDLGKLSGVAWQTIQALEDGLNNVEQVKLATLIKLAKALRVKVRDFLPKDSAKYL